MHLDQPSVTRSAGRERPWLHRLAPLALVVVVMAVVFAMGWHRYLSLETLARHRAAIDGFKSCVSTYRKTPVLIPL